MRQWRTRCQQNISFLSKFFCFLLFEGTFTSFFKDKKSKRSKRSDKIVDINVFLNLFALLWKDPDPDPYRDPYKK